MLYCRLTPETFMYNTMHNSAYIYKTHKQCSVLGPLHLFFFIVLQNVFNSVSTRSCVSKSSSYRVRLINILRVGTRSFAHVRPTLFRHFGSSSVMAGYSGALGRCVDVDCFPFFQQGAHTRRRKSRTLFVYAKGNNEQTQL